MGGQKDVRCNISMHRSVSVKANKQQGENIYCNSMCVEKRYQHN